MPEILSIHEKRSWGLKEAMLWGEKKMGREEFCENIKEKNEEKCVFL